MSSDAPSERSEAEVWIDEGPVAPATRKGGANRGQRGRAGRPKGDSRVDHARKPKRAKNVGGVSLDLRLLSDLVGARRAERLQGRVESAAESFAAGRYGDARQVLAPIAREVPGMPEVRELHGLVLYRLGRWKDAIRELQAFGELTGSTEQHPVLADCRRALKQYREVDRLWNELKAASPSGPLVTEGRIVAAGALADQGDLAGAVKLLGKGFKFPKRPAEHQLRRAYALADLYERSGDMPQARMLFGRIAHFAPDYLDAADRSVGLG